LMGRLRAYRVRTGREQATDLTREDTHR